MQIKLDDTKNYGVKAVRRCKGRYLIESYLGKILYMRELCKI